MGLCVDVRIDCLIDFILFIYLFIFVQVKIKKVFIMCLDIKKIWRFSYIFVEGLFFYYFIIFIFTFYTQPHVLHLLDIFQPRPFLRRKLSLTLLQNGLKGPILLLPVYAQTLSPVQGVLMRNGLILLFLLLLKGLFYTFYRRNIILLYNEIQCVFGFNLKSHLILLFN